MLAGIIVLSILTVILLSLLLLGRYERRSIVRQLREIEGQDTNRLVHTIGGHSAELINAVNSLLSSMRQNQIDYRRRQHGLEQILTNISHDLRTPLTSATGYIEILREADLTPAERAQKLEIVEKRLFRLEELIDSFFEFSQIVSSGKPPERSLLNLVAILEESIAHYYDDYCAAHRTVRLECPLRTLPVCSNQNMLLRIFDNLIGNALKHGSGSLGIFVSETDTVQIRFENPLLDANLDIPHIFDEFYTTDISRTSGNTGLGLAITKQFTQMLGGTITAKYQEQRFCITVEFPRPKDQPQ